MSATECLKMLGQIKESVAALQARRDELIAENLRLIAERDAAELALKNKCSLSGMQEGYFCEKARVAIAERNAAQKEQDIVDLDTCAESRRVVFEAGDTIKNLRTQLTASQDSEKKLREALEYYAKPENWKCRRCGKHDLLNCFNSMYCGPMDEGEDGQPWTFAQNALALEPPKDVTEAGV